MTRAGTPPTIVRGGTGLVTTAPAPTMASSPTSAITTALLPIHVPRPIRTMRRVARLIANRRRRIDTVCSGSAGHLRAGGDEYAVPDVGEADRAERSDIGCVPQSGFRSPIESLRTRSPPCWRHLRGCVRRTPVADTARGDPARVTAAASSLRGHDPLRRRPASERSTPAAVEPQRSRPRALRP
jgi:hypothetical protein